MQHHYHRKLAVHSLFTYGTSICLIIIRLAKNAIIARLLGPTYRGIFGLLILIPDLLASLGDMGIGPSINYYVAKEHYDLKKILGGILLFIALMGSILFIIGFIIIETDLFFSKEMKKVIDYKIFILCAIPLALLSNLGNSFLIAKSRIYSLNIISFIGSIIPLLLFLIFYILLNQVTIDAAVWSWFVGVIIISLSPYFLLRRDNIYPPRSGFLFLKKCFNYGIKSHLANFSLSAMRRSDFLFISYLLGATELGYYAISTAIAEMLLILPESIGVPFIPIIFGMKKDESKIFTPMVIKVVLLLMLIACLFTALICRILIIILFGYEYLPSYPTLLILLPGMISLGLYPILKADLLGRNRPGTVSILTTVALLFNLLLNWWFIPILGIKGAAVSSSISYTLTVILCFILYSRLSNNRIIETLFLSKREWCIIYDYLRSKIFK